MHTVNDLERTIEDFLHATSRDWAAMDGRTFADTADALTLDPVIAQEWIEHHVEPLLCALERTDIPAERIARAFHNPSSLRAVLYYDLLMAKIAQKGVRFTVRIFEEYARLLHAFCVEDPFAKNYTNRTHRSQEIKRHRTDMLDAVPPIAKSLGRLASACYQLSYGLYSDMNPQLVYDNFGPYHLDDGSLVAIKQFGNLRPLSLWQQTAALPFDTIEMHCRYEGVSMSVDAITHAVYSGDTIGGLTHWACMGDGKRLSITEIENATRAIECVAIDVYRAVLELPEEEKNVLYIRQKAYSYHKACALLGLDWQPHPNVINAMRTKTAHRRWNIPEHKEDLLVFMKTALDPRLELLEGLIQWVV